MYYYETSIINDYILYIEDDIMWYFDLFSPLQLWCKYDASASDYFKMLTESGASLRAISKKKVVLLGVPLCE